MNGIPIPCTQERCLKLPACKNRKQIECDLILEWYHGGITRELNWAILYKVFPDLVSIAPELQSRHISTPEPEHLSEYNLRRKLLTYE